MRIVVCESPYRATSEWQLRLNLAYARALVERVTLRGDSPVASHLLITQALDDRDPVARQRGIWAGLYLLRVADVHAFGIDLGISDGMRIGMEKAKQHPSVIYEEISLPEWAEAMATDSNTRRGFDARETLARRYEPKWHVHEAG
jgi:acid stress-induced BolA-like protein IbaG/YrbA